MFSEKNLFSYSPKIYKRIEIMLPINNQKVGFMSLFRLERRTISKNSPEVELLFELFEAEYNLFWEFKTQVNFYF